MIEFRLIFVKSGEEDIPHLLGRWYLQVELDKIPTRQKYVCTVWGPERRLGETRYDIRTSMLGYAPVTIQVERLESINRVVQALAKLAVLEVVPELSEAVRIEVGPGMGESG